MAAISETGEDVVKFVPGELCVVCAVAPGVSAPPNLSALVGRWLNARIAETLPKVRPGAARTALARDLERCLPGLKERFTGNGEVLREIPRQTDDAPESTVLLPRPRSVRRGAGTALLFLAFGRPEHTLRERLEDVEGLVKLINRHALRGAAADQPFAGVTVQAATPNWLLAGTPNGESSDSPGAEPETAPAGSWTLKLGDADACALAEGRTEGAALVAVLDTCPQRGAVTRAAGRRPAKGNWLLQRLARDLSAGTFVVDAWPSIGRDFLNQRLDAVLPNWRNRLQEGHSYDSSDHGLFVSGVIRDVAREAEIHLIRVLNDYGVGDLWSLSVALSRLPELLSKHPLPPGGGTSGTSGRPPRRKLVVNLSLGADIWPGQHLLHYWLPATAAALEGRIGKELDEDVSGALKAHGHQDVLTVLNSSHLALREAVGWLIDAHGALVVAAAGNDYDTHDPSLNQKPRQEPRFPARHDHVFGVAAVGPTGAPAEYSNRGDVLALENGVATFGGQAHRPAQGQMPRIVEGEGFVGVCSAGRLPIGSGSTANGWMTWAGTSFATPIITALAAKQWGAKTPQPQAPGDVIAAVRALVTNRSGGVTLDPHLATPTIVVTQEDDPAATGLLR